MERSIFYEPLECPVRGIRSNTADSVNVPGSGFFKQLQNVRWAETGVLGCRLGIPTALSGAIAASSIFRGAFSCVFNNTFGTLFATTKDASNLTHIWKSTDAATWTEITTSTGKYGDTRLAADGSNNDYETSFALVHDKPTGKDVGVFQNGVNVPVVYDGTSLVKHEAVPLPSNRDSMRVFYQWKSSTSMGNPAHFTVGGGGAGVVLTDGGIASPDDFATLTINAAATGDNANFTIATPVHWEDATQIHVIVEGTSDVIRKFVQGIKIEVRDTSGGAVTKSLYQPYDATVVGSDAFPQPTETGIVDIPGWVVLSYPVPSDWITATVDKVTFTWAQAVGSGASVALNILSMCASNHTTGAIKGAAQHAISWYNSGSRGESEELALPNHFQFLQALGVKTVTSATFGGISTLGALIPDSSLINYTATIYARNTTDAQRDKGVDTLRIYRQDYGEDTYYYSKSLTLASWGGASWSYTTGSALSLFTVDDTTASGDREFSLVSPGSFQEPIPIGRAMAAANNRLIVAGKATDLSGTTSDAFPRICESRFGNPFRFSEVADPDDIDSAGEARIAGENIQAFAVSNPPGMPVSTVTAFTDSAVWTVATHVPASALFLTRGPSTGTNSPHSVAEHMGEIYYMDVNLRFRRLSDGAWISRAVDDKLQGIPAAQRRSVFACWFNDRVYLAYTPTGQTTNKRILVWSEIANAWESDDLLPSGEADILLRWVGGSGTYATSQDPRLLFFDSSDRKVYRYESGTQDKGSDIAVVITTGDLHKDLNAWTIKYWEILCDSGTQTLTMAVTWKPKNPAGSTGGVLPLTNTNPYVWAKSTIFESGTADSFSGVAGASTITGSVAGGLKIYGLAIYPEHNSGNPVGN